MKVFDCFTFFNENDLLELRMQELWPVVDKFVLVHSNMNFRGETKPNYLDYDRFKPYQEKLYEIWSSSLSGVSAWDREADQRNLMQPALIYQAADDDMIILSDVDEIPRRKTVDVLKNSFRVLDADVLRLRLKKFSYGINMLTDEGNTVAKITRGSVAKMFTPQYIRKLEPSAIIEDAGWEFSSLGTPEDIYLKFKSFSHSEFDDVISVKKFARRMRQGKDLLNRDIKMTPVEIDDTWPEGIKDNRDYWRKYEWSV